MATNSMPQGALGRRRLLQALVFSTVFACAPLETQSSPPLELSELIRRNTLARGGAAALDRVQSITFDVEIVEGGQLLNGRYAATTAGLVRIDVYAGGSLVFSEGVDKVGAWNRSPGEPPKPSVEAGRAALLNGATNHLFGWHRFSELGHKLRLMPPSITSGTAFPVVEVRYATNQASYFDVDPSTWLVVRRRDERAYHPDIDATKQKVETHFDEFKAMKGIVASTRSTDIDIVSGKTLATNRVLFWQINARLSSIYFDRDRDAPAKWHG